MPLVTIELPTGEIVKVEVTPLTTLRELAAMVKVNPDCAVFYCSRYEGELGTLMAPGPYGALSDPFEKFNTTSCVILLN
jgi:hypothetical protein